MNEEINQDDLNSESNRPTLSQQLELLRQALESFLKGFSGKETLSDIVYDLNQQYDILEETLATVVNWLALHKSIIRAFGSLEKLTEEKILNQSEEEIKRTIRTGLLPQSGTMVQDVVAGLRGSTKIMQIIEKDLVDLNNKISVIKGLDEKFLQVIEYESALSDGLFSEILNNIYSSQYDESTKKLYRLLNNVKEFSEEKSHKQV